MINNKELTLFDKLQLYMFEPDPSTPYRVVFTPHELEVKKRYEAVFAFWLEKPTLSDKKVIQFMVTSLGMSKSQAYRDLPNIKVLLGNVRNAAKEWQRYKLIAMLDKAYELAEAKKNAAAMIMAADKLGKYTNLDKEDVVPVPYNEIVPQSFEPTSDVSVLGIEPMQDLQERQRRMREKYGATPIEEADYEMSDGEED